MRDVRDELTTADHDAAGSADRVADDAPIEIRLMRSEDCVSAAHAFFRCYGSSYECDWSYQPDAFAERLERREMVSVVAIDEPGEVVGHLGVDLDRPDAKVGDSAHAIVDPRYRGHHLFESMKTFMAEWAKEGGMYGLVSDATAAHPYSQRGNLALGAHETGFLLGSIRAGVDYKAIVPGDEGHRLTTATFYLRTNDEPDRTSHAPETIHPFLERVYAHGSFRREIVADHPVPNGETRLTETDWTDDDEVLLTATHVGPDLHEVLASRLESATARDAAVIYLDLPLAEPATASIDVADLGFFYGSVMPELRDDGDVLRLQLLHGVDPHVGEIATASDFGRTLLTEIAESMPRR